MKYKAGDKVKVRENLEVNKRYGTEEFIEEMEEYKGKIVTIDTVNKDDYYIEEDKQSWSWTEEMLEDVEEEMTIGQVIDNLMNNPDIIIKNLTKLTEECKKVNEDLEVKLKKKQSEIDFLKGQISVYEKFLNGEDLKNEQ